MMSRSVENYNGNGSNPDGFGNQDVDIGWDGDPVKEPLKWVDHQIGRLDLLTAEEERYYAQKIELNRVLNEVEMGGDVLGRMLSKSKLYKKMNQNGNGATPGSDTTKEDEEIKFLERAPHTYDVKTVYGDLIRQVKSLDEDQRNQVREEAKEAMEVMVFANNGLVKGIAKRYLGRLPWEDLLQFGYEGMVNGVNRYDYRLGFRLSTYVTWWIRQTISRNANKNDYQLHITDEQRRLIKRYNRIRLGQPDIDDKEMMETLAITDPNKFEELKSVSEIRMVPINAGFNEFDVDEVEEWLEASTDPSPATLADKSLTRMQVIEVLGQLEVKRQLVLRLRFGIYDDTNLFPEDFKEKWDLYEGKGNTLGEVADILADMGFEGENKAQPKNDRDRQKREGPLTRERIRQFEKEAFRKIKFGDLKIGRLKSLDRG
jgi:RNA polymerase sigma factor (sigma-70 family)